jgi:hypothetical protein
VFGFVVPMARVHRGPATVRTRSGRVIKQWMIVAGSWGLLLGPSALAIWWAQSRSMEPLITWLLAPAVLLTGLSILVAMGALAVEFVGAVRQLRGLEPRKPWFSVSYEQQGADPEPWEIPKLW